MIGMIGLISIVTVSSISNVIISITTSIIVSIQVSDRPITGMGVMGMKDCNGMCNLIRV